MKLLRSLSFAIATAVCCAVPFAAQAQGKIEKPKVSIAVGGKASFYYLPLTIAERLGYFKDEGLEVEMPTAGIYALAASLALLLEIGLDVVASRIEKTLGVLVDGLPRVGFTPVLFGGPPRSGILAARPPAGKDARYYAKRLADENIVVSPREGFLRFSPHAGNDEAEAERILSELGSL